MAFSVVYWADVGRRRTKEVKPPMTGTDYLLLLVMGHVYIHSTMCLLFSVLGRHVVRERDGVRHTRHRQHFLRSNTDNAK